MVRPINTIIAKLGRKVNKLVKDIGTTLLKCKDGYCEPSSFLLNFETLLDDYVRAGFFEFLLGIRRSVLANSCEDFPAGGFSEGLGFAETEAGQLTNDLDHVNLLGAGILDDHIELGLLFHRFSSSGGAANSSQFADVPQPKMDLYQQHWWKQVHTDVRIKKTKWVVLRYPTDSFAQAAKMSTTSGVTCSTWT